MNTETCTMPTDPTIPCWQVLTDEFGGVDLIPVNDIAVRISVATALIANPDREVGFTKDEHRRAMRWLAEIQATLDATTAPGV